VIFKLETLSISGPGHRQEYDRYCGGCVGVEYWRKINFIYSNSNTPPLIYSWTKLGGDIWSPRCSDALFPTGDNVSRLIQISVLWNEYWLVFLHSSHGKYNELKILILNI